MPQTAATAPRAARPLRIAYGPAHTTLAYGPAYTPTAGMRATHTRVVAPHGCAPRAMAPCAPPVATHAAHLATPALAAQARAAVQHARLLARIAARTATVVHVAAVHVAAAAQVVALRPLRVACARLRRALGTAPRGPVTPVQGAQHKAPTRAMGAVKRAAVAYRAAKLHTAQAWAALASAFAAAYTAGPCKAVR